MIKQIEKGSFVSPKGFEFTGIHSGVKKENKDLGLIYSQVPAVAAAVYTLNKVQAEPVKLTKSSVAKESLIQAVIVNSGNANACTGKKGMEDAILMQTTVADKLGIKPNYVAVASTGVIGEGMPMDKIIPGISKLNTGKEAIDATNFAESILTTDTFTKVVTFQTEIDGEIVTMSGVAKGSGMIEPNMGTMLGFIYTDANVSSSFLDNTLKSVTNQTFNCITVDGDTSTNDMVLVMANGQANNEKITANHQDADMFKEMLKATSEALSKMIARDGEGATKLIDVTVTNAVSVEDAKKIAKSIVGSSLVKTAVFGTDANWGRIIAAIGYSEAEFDPEKIDLKIGHITLLKQSEPVKFSEEEAKVLLENEIVNIYVNLNDGEYNGKAWGCDLTYDYVSINASYRS